MKTKIIVLMSLFIIGNCTAGKDLLMFLDQRVNPSETDGNIGPVVAGLVLGIYEKIPMIVHAHLLLSYLQATKKAENIQIAEAVKKIIAWGKIEKKPGKTAGKKPETPSGKKPAEDKDAEKLAAVLGELGKKLGELKGALGAVGEEEEEEAGGPVKSEQEIRDEVAKTVAEEAEKIAKEIGAGTGKKPMVKTPSGKPTKAFGESPAEKAVIDYKLCFVGLNNAEWYIYVHKNYDLVLLIPKNIAEKSPARISHIDEQVASLGFNVLGEKAPLQRLEDVSRDTLIKFLTERTVSRGTDAWNNETTLMAEAIESMFLVSARLEAQEPWQIYIDGHGGAIAQRGEAKKPEESEFSSLTSTISGMSHKNFSRLLHFFNTKIPVRFVGTFSCFLGGYKQAFLEAWLKTIKTNFPVVAIGAGNNYVRSGILGAAEFGYEEKEGSKIPLLKFKHSFKDFFQALNLYFGDEVQRKDFIKRATKIGKEKMAVFDPLALIFQTILLGDTIYANNQPFVYFPHIGIFTALNFDKNIKIINNVIAKKHALEGTDINIGGKKGVLITVQKLQSRLILGEALIESELKPETLRQTAAEESAIRARRDYGYIHFFEDVHCFGSLAQCIYNFVKCNPSFYTVFLIRNLTCSNYENSGIEGSPNLTLNDVIILIRGAESLYTSEGITGTLEIGFRIGEKQYRGTMEIKDFEKLTVRQIVEQLRFNAEVINFDDFAGYLLREDDAKKLQANVTSSGKKLSITDLFNTLAAIVEQRVTTSSSVASEQRGALGRFARMHIDQQTRFYLAVLKKQLAELQEITDTFERTKKMARVITKIRKNHGLDALGWDSFIKDVLENGWVNIPDERGRTPIFEAALRADKPHMASLIKLGAHVNVRDNGGLTPLGYVIQKMNVAILVDLGEWWNTGQGRLRAIDEKFFDVISLLLEYGADVDVRIKNDYDPLREYHIDDKIPLTYRALGFDFKNILELLLKYGAPTEFDGKKLINFALKYSTQDLVETLLASGVSFDPKSEEAKKILLSLIEKPTFLTPQKIEHLLTLGVDIGLKKSALDIAKKNLKALKKISREDAAYKKERQRVLQKCIIILEQWEEKKPKERQEIRDSYYHEVLIPKRKKFEKEKAALLKKQAPVAEETGHPIDEREEKIPAQPRIIGNPTEEFTIKKSKKFSEPDAGLEEEPEKVVEEVSAAG